MQEEMKQARERNAYPQKRESGSHFPRGQTRYSLAVTSCGSAGEKISDTVPRLFGDCFAQDPMNGNPDRIFAILFRYFLFFSVLRKYE